MKATITINFESPDECTRKQFEEWLDFHINNGCMNQDNPLAEYELYLDDLISDGAQTSYEIEDDEETKL